MPLEISPWENINRIYSPLIEKYISDPGRDISDRISRLFGNHGYGSAGAAGWTSGS